LSDVWWMKPSDIRFRCRGAPDFRTSTQSFCAEYEIKHQTREVIAQHQATTLLRRFSKSCSQNALCLEPGLTDRYSVVAVVLAKGVADVRALAGLDDTDRKILALLQVNDRLGLAQLASKVRSSPSTINDRIKRLVRIGVITGFHAQIAAETVGLELLAFVLVVVAGSKVERRFVEKIGEISKVLECHRLDGEWNYILKLRVRNIHELEDFIGETLASIPGVQRTNTMIAFSSIKETWTVPL
jgi:Lrp/AsnC family transcriptional regulator, leucine-responsive regulatory protein